MTARRPSPFFRNAPQTTAAQEARKQKDGEDPRQKLINSQEVLLLAAECFSETQQRGKLADLERELRTRVEIQAESSYPRTETLSELPREMFEHPSWAVQFHSQLWDLPRKESGWLESVLDSAQATANAKDEACTQLALLLGPSQQLWDSLIPRLCQSNDAYGLQGSILRTIDTTWPTAEPPSAKASTPTPDSAAQVGVQSRTTRDDSPGLLQALQLLFKAQPNLTGLSLDGCTGLTDTALLAQCKNLRDLFLNGCTGLQGKEALQGLASLTELNLLGLSNCTGLTDTAPLAQCKKLRHLFLNGCTGLKGKEALEGLVELKSLRHLDLDDCNGLSQGDVDWFNENKKSKCSYFFH